MGCSVTGEGALIHWRSIAHWSSPPKRAIAAAGIRTVGISFGLPLFFYLRARERDDPTSAV